MSETTRPESPGQVNLFLSKQTDDNLISKDSAENSTESPL